MNIKLCNQQWYFDMIYHKFQTHCLLNAKNYEWEYHVAINVACYKLLLSVLNFFLYMHIPSSMNCLGASTNF